MKLRKGNGLRKVGKIVSTAFGLGKVTDREAALARGERIYKILMLSSKKYLWLEESEFQVL